MKVILAEDEEAEKFFEDLINRVADRVIRRFETALKQRDNIPEEDNLLWVGRDEAKKILGVKSKKKLQLLRDRNLIRTSRHGRIIRYYKPSLIEFLERNVQT